MKQFRPIAHQLQGQPLWQQVLLLLYSPLAVTELRRLGSRP